MKVNNETKVGILAILSFSLLVLGFNYMKNLRLFDSTFEMKTFYDNVDGLIVGNPVNFNGMRVGQVTGIRQIPESGRIEVTYNLTKGLLIPQDSKANIASDLLGYKNIRIDKGKEKKMAKSGGVLEGITEKTLPQTLMSEILPLKDNISDLIVQMEHFVGWLNNTMDDATGNKIDNILDDLETTTQNIKFASGWMMDTLTRNVNGTIATARGILTDFRSKNEVITKIMNNTASFTDSLSSTSSSLKSMIAKTNQTIGTLQDILQKVNDGEGSLGAAMTNKDLYNNVNEAVTNLNTMIDIYKEGVPFKIHLGDPERRDKRRADRKAGKPKVQ